MNTGSDFGALTSVIQPQYFEVPWEISGGTNSHPFRFIRMYAARLSHSRPDIRCSIYPNAQVTETNFGAGHQKSFYCYQTTLKCLRNFLELLQARLYFCSAENLRESIFCHKQRQTLKFGIHIIKPIWRDQLVLHSIIEYSEIKKNCKVYYGRRNVII